MDEYLGVLNHWAGFKGVEKVTNDQLHKAYPTIKEPVEKTPKPVEKKSATEKTLKKKENQPSTAKSQKKEEGPKSSLQRQKASIHCESTLAVAFVNAHCNDPTSTHLTIGVSKLCCLLCREFIAILQYYHPHIKIYTPSCHGKITAGWRMPKETSQEVMAGMKKRIDDMCDEIMARSTGRLRPDFVHQDLSSSSEEVSPSSDSTGTLPPAPPNSPTMSGRS